MRKIQVIIADDHELIIDGLTMTLGQIPEVELLGEASNGEQLVRLTRKTKPDVIITDVKMPVMDGIQATKQIKSEFPHIGIIALSSYDEEHLISDMLAAGAKGYLLKTAHKSEIYKAIQTVFKNQNYYCRETNARLSEMVVNKGHHPSKDCKEKFSERERQVISLICKGLTSPQIAEQLNLKRRTVERYRDSIMEKMDVHNSAGVVAFALNHRVCDEI